MSNDRGKAVGAVLAFLYAACGKPNPSTPKQVLWTGTVEQFRAGVLVNAEDPRVCPEDDDEMVDLLHHARPTVRHHKFRMSPQSITADSVIKVTSCPNGYQPKWKRAR